jgi:2-oxoglutarate dehydrogenase E2 component (dihydrolipoamide succinyltransferase)
MSYTPTASPTTAGPADPVEVTMPETGSFELATVIRWLKQPGTRVGVGEPLCLVAWEDIIAEVGSPAAGTLRSQLLPPGEAVALGGGLALIDPDR